MSIVEDLPAPTQIAIWGAAWAGDAADLIAMLAEWRPGKWLGPRHHWDKDASYLATIERWIDGQRDPAPAWWALACAFELATQVYGP